MNALDNVRALKIEVEWLRASYAALANDLEEARELLKDVMNHGEVREVLLCRIDDFLKGKENA